MDRPTQQEQLDACRSASDAAGDPELRALAEALANDAQLAAQLENQLAADRVILERLENVPAPPDLKERLVVAFRQGAERNAHDRSRMTEVVGRAVEAKSEDDLSRDKIQPVQKTLVTRRRYLGTLVGVATVVCAFIAVTLFWNRPTALKEANLSEAVFAEKAVSLCTDANGKWNPANSAKQPALAWKSRELPFVQGVAPSRWKEVSTNFAGKCVVWEVSAPQGAQAYVVMTSSPWEAGKLPTAVSRTPIHNSGGWSAGAWRRNGIAYALVIEGNAKAFGDLIENKLIARMTR